MSIELGVLERPKALVSTPGHHAAVARVAGLAVAVVGCGYWGAKHVRVLSTLPEVARVIVVDPNPKIRDAIVAAFPGVEGAPELRKVLPHVQAVIVATPPRNHAEIALQALRAGRHVLIEKPLTTSLAEARLLVAEADRYGAVLMAGHTFEFNPAVRELRRRMDEGELGTIHYIHSARLNLGLYRPDVNVVWDLAPHDISIMNYLLRSTPTTVGAWGSSHACGDVKDLAYIRLDYGQRGVMGYAHVSWLDPRKVRRVTVVGSRKMAVYDDLAEERLRIFDCGIEGGPGAVDQPAPFERPVSYRYGDIVSPHIHFEEPLALEDRHFVDCIRQRGSPQSDGASGMAVVAVLEAIDRALATGRDLPVEAIDLARPSITA
jgi:predicted dehydrogenase